MMGTGYSCGAKRGWRDRWLIAAVVLLAGLVVLSLNETLMGDTSEGGADGASEAEERATDRAGDSESNTEEGDDPAPTLEELRRAERIVRGVWRQYALSFVRHGEEFVYSPHFVPGSRNSRGFTAAEVIQIEAQTPPIEYHGPLKRFVPCAEEIAAVTELLPELGLGEFGKLHSVTVSKITGADEMVVEAPVLIDEAALVAAEAEAQKRLMDWARAKVGADHHNPWYRQRRQYYADRAYERRLAEIDYQFRLRKHLLEQQKGWTEARIVMKGFPTRTLLEGEQWTGHRGQGIEIMIVSRQDEQWVGIPVEQAMRSRPDFAGFEQLLATKGYTTYTFAKLIDRFRTLPAKELRERVMKSLARGANGGGVTEEQVKEGEAEGDGGADEGEGDRPEAEKEEKEKKPSGGGMFGS